MFSLRCTKKLLTHISATPILGEKSPTTELGDWYANLVPTCRGGVVICTNERTLLTVVLPLIEGQHPLSMLTMRVFNLFRLLGVPEDRAEAELKEMDNVEIRKSQNRKVLGSMNEIAFILQVLSEEASGGELKASEAELAIAKNIFSYTKFQRPEELVRALLCADYKSVN